MATLLDGALGYGERIERTVDSIDRGIAAHRERIALLEGMRRLWQARCVQAGGHVYKRRDVQRGRPVCLACGYEDRA